MSLDKIVEEIFEPHRAKLRAYIVNEILEEVTDIVLDEYANCNPLNRRKELLNKVLEKLGVKDDATD